jgi:type IV pilus biogenesis protein CpaD/CtpE
MADISKSVLSLIACVLVAGCAGLPGSVPVGASMPEVEAQLGKPKDTVAAPGGDVVWQYPTGPIGQWTYMVRFGSDRRVKSVSQALTVETFAQIRTGMSRDDIRLLLGPPGEVVTYRNLRENVWSYRYQPGAGENRIFNVHFDAASGLVRSTSEQEDPLFVPPIRVVG